MSYMTISTNSNPMMQLLVLVLAAASGQVLYVSYKS